MYILCPCAQTHKHKDTLLSPMEPRGTLVSLCCYGNRCTWGTWTGSSNSATFWWNRATTLYIHSLHSQTQHSAQTADERKMAMIITYVDRGSLVTHSIQRWDTQKLTTAQRPQNEHVSWDRSPFLLMFYSCWRLWQWQTLLIFCCYNLHPFTLLI